MTTQSASLEPEPAIKPKPVHWALLENAGAGFELKYPADVFAPKPGAREADDRLFVSEDGHAVLRVYANRGGSATVPSKHRASLLAKRYAGASLDYAPQRENWFVLSGTLGAGNVLRARQLLVRPPVVARLAHHLPGAGAAVL